MLRLAAWFLFFVLAPAAAVGQNPPAKHCPAIAFDEVNSFAYLGAPAHFVLDVSAVDPTVKLDYLWTVSAGSIVDGANSASITVETADDLTDPIVATVTVLGLPPDCESKFTLQRARITCGLARKFDEYGGIKWADERARLDNVAAEFQANPTTKVYLVSYGGRKSFAGEATYYGDRARDYLIRRRQVLANSVIVIDGGYREGRTTEIWIMPEKAEPPIGFPTVDPSEVVFTEPVPRTRTQ